MLASSPNGRLQIAQIGVGNRGKGNRSALMRLPNMDIVALCDVDRNYLAEAKTEVPGAATFSDYRKMMDAMADRIDAVLVCTPDHMHAPISTLAMEAGKHVYCEKPLAHNVVENRQLRLLAEERNLVTQLGIQVSVTIAQRMTVEYVRGGLIGKVSEVHVWSNKKWGGRKRFRRARIAYRIRWIGVFGWAWRMNGFIGRMYSTRGNGVDC